MYVLFMLFTCAQFLTAWILDLDGLAEQGAERCDWLFVSALFSKVIIENIAQNFSYLEVKRF